MSMGSLTDPEKLGRLLAASGYFSDARDAAQAVVKVLAGAELGFGPIQSMTGVFIVKGRVTLSANLVAAAIKRHPAYDYRVRQHTADVCEIEFFGPTTSGAGRESLGSVEFSMDMAKRAGLSGGENWRKYPEAMLFARTITSGARYLVPDVFGSPIYTPDELDETILVDNEGQVLQVNGERSKYVPEAAPPPQTFDPVAQTVGPNVAMPTSVAARAKHYEEAHAEAEAKADAAARGRVVIEDVTPPNNGAPPAEKGAQDPEQEKVPEDPEAELTPEQRSMLTALLARDDGAASFVRFGLIAQGFDADNPDALGKLSQGQAHEVIASASKRFGNG